MSHTESHPDTSIGGTPSSSITFEHVGVVVNDLEATARFFEALGFERQDPFDVGGPWVDRINGLEGTRVTGMFVTAPDGSGALELIQFHEPTREQGETNLPANAHGFRHIAYRVSNIETIAGRSRAAGYDLIGEIVNYQEMFLLAYVRGPEGLIVELAQPLSSGS
jgi:catechol 2,3-dioxygenase-like lactoylglutathione lyase family enzyme